MAVIAPRSFADRCDSKMLSAPPRSVPVVRSHHESIAANHIPRPREEHRTKLEPMTSPGLARSEATQRGCHRTHHNSPPIGADDIPRPREERSDAAWLSSQLHSHTYRRDSKMLSAPTPRSVPAVRSHHESIGADDIPRPREERSDAARLSSHPTATQTSPQSRATFIPPRTQRADRLRPSTSCPFRG